MVCTDCENVALRYGVVWRFSSSHACSTGGALMVDWNWMINNSYIDFSFIRLCLGTISHLNDTRHIVLQNYDKLIY